MRTLYMPETVETSLSPPAMSPDASTRCSTLFSSAISAICAICTIGAVGGRARGADSSLSFPAIASASASSTANCPCASLARAALMLACFREPDIAGRKNPTKIRVITRVAATFNSGWYRTHQAEERMTSARFPRPASRISRRRAASSRGAASRRAASPLWSAATVAPMESASARHRAQSARWRSTSCRAISSSLPARYSTSRPCCSVSQFMTASPRRRPRPPAAPAG